MFELFLLTLLVALIVLSIRRGKPVGLDNPIIIQRPGQYHITLAPQLDRAQTFIEQIAARFPLPNPPPQAGEGSNESLREFFVKGELPSQFFEVRDPGVPAREGGCYLLAGGYRGGAGGQTNRSVSFSLKASFPASSLKCATPACLQGKGVVICWPPHTAAGCCTFRRSIRSLCCVMPTAT